MSVEQLIASLVLAAIIMIASVVFWWDDRELRRMNQELDTRFLHSINDRYVQIDLATINAKRKCAMRQPLTDTDVRQALTERRPEDSDLTTFLIGYTTGLPIPSSDGMGIIGAAVSPMHHVETPSSPPAVSFGYDSGNDVAGSSGGGDW